ncbi:MAG: hypothetical protein A2Y33_07905 [Spirochaetes bacterium GWF1_51_8]|nr:MAG: hypothetical protein A2Y33_07905 [Spirochaetes bacterium GWF1_51_8]
MRGKFSILFVFILIFTVSCGPKIETDFFKLAASGDIEGMKLLISKGTNVNSAATNGWTALLFAMTNGSTAAVEYLISAGANFSNKTGETTALHFAVEHELTQMIVLLKNKGVNPDMFSGIHTPLMLAAEKGLTNSIKVLLEQGAEIDAINNFSWTALMYAVKAGQKEAVKLLVKGGASFKSKDYFDEKNVMIIAVESGNLDMLKLLAALGGDVNMPMKVQSGAKLLFPTPLDIAEKLGDKKMIDYLKAKGAVSSTLSPDDGSGE